MLVELFITDSFNFTSYSFLFAFIDLIVDQLDKAQRAFASLFELIFYLLHVLDHLYVQNEISMIRLL